MAYLTSIRHLRNEEGTGADMRPAIISGIVTMDAPADFCPSLVTVPEVFAKINSAQFPSRF